MLVWKIPPPMLGSTIARIQKQSWQPLAGRTHLLGRKRNKRWAQFQPHGHFHAAARPAHSSGRRSGPGTLLRRCFSLRRSRSGWLYQVDFRAPESILSLTFPIRNPPPDELSGAAISFQTDCADCPAPQGPSNNAIKCMGAGGIHPLAVRMRVCLESSRSPSVGLNLGPLGLHRGQPDPFQSREIPSGYFPIATPIPHNGRVLPESLRYLLRRCMP